jgi:hypothetical protein
MKKMVHPVDAYFLNSTHCCLGKMFNITNANRDK